MIYIDPNLNTPLYRQIYDAIKLDIVIRNRKEGEKLPSIRGLALQLGVSISTVVQAYDQLVSEGYLENRKGSGHYVSHMDIPEEPVRKKLYLPPRQTDDTEKYRYNMSLSSVDLRDFPIRKFRKNVDRSLMEAAEHNLGSDYDTISYPPLLDAISYFLNTSRGVNCTPDQIILGTATHQILNVVARIMRNKFGIRRIIVEDPGQRYAHQVFTSWGIQLIPVPVRENGIDMDEVELYDHCAIMVTPGNQFPTGRSMTIQNRYRLLKWAEERSGYIIEDDRESFFSFRTQPMFALQGMDQSERVLYFNSTSRIVSPGFRFCFFVLPQLWNVYYNELYREQQSNVPAFLQRALCYFMEDGSWDSYLKKVARLYLKKKELFVRALQENLNPALKICDSDGGLLVCVESDGTMNEREMIEKAARAGVKVYPMSVYWMRISVYHFDRVLIGFAGLTENQLAEAAGLLTEAWKS